jgi:hypothetical protein
MPRQKTAQAPFSTAKRSCASASSMVSSGSSAAQSTRPLERDQMSASQRL